MTIFIILIVVCVFFWKAIQFVLAGAIWLVNAGRWSMNRCEDTARGVLGAAIALLVLVAMFGAL